MRRLNIRAAVQSGKTLVGEIFKQWVMANAPGPFQWNFPTDDDATEHYRDRILPMTKACRANAWLAKAVRRRRDHCQFPPMSLFCGGANLTNLQRKSVRYQINEELWDWRPGYPDEAFGRTEAFKDTCKVLNSGQAGEAGDQWDEIWEAG